MHNTSDFFVKNGVLEKYKGAGGDVVIPEGVKKIGWWAFAGYSSLPEGMIPERARENSKPASGGY